MSRFDDVPSENMVCSVCLTGLDWMEGEGWVHSLAQQLLVSGVMGHEPVPVPLENVIEHRLRCDFCFGADPTWTIPAESFEVMGINAGSHEDWAACDVCHDIVESGDQGKLANRIMTESPVYSAFRGIERADVQIALQSWLRQFFAARKGGDYRGLVHR